MDSINELIAAGELMIEKCKKMGLGNEQNYRPKEISLSNLMDGSSNASERSFHQNTNDESDNIFTNKILITTSGNSTLNEREIECKTSYSDTSASSHNKIASESSITNSSSDYDHTGHISSNNSQEQSSSAETFSQYHLQKLREECALIFSLSHSMASSLLNANRILQHMMSSESGKASNAEESLRSEISSCNVSCKENEEELQSASYRLHNLLGQVSESYYKSKEQEETLSQIRSQTLELFDLTKELLKKHNLCHLVGDVSGIRSPIRIMEEVKLCLTLLLGEFPSRLLHQQTIELQESKNYQKRLEYKFEALEKELQSSGKEKVKQLVQLEIELERKIKELEVAKEEITHLHKEQESSETQFEKEITEAEKRRTLVVEELVRVKEFQDEMKAFATEEREKHDFLISKLEEEVSVLKSKLRSFDEDKLAQEVNSEKACKELEERQHRIFSEIDQYKAKIIKMELEKQTYSDRVKALETDIEKQNTLNESLKADIAALVETSQKKSEEVAADLLLLERKLDSNNEELCEKSSEIRQYEVLIMELKTDLSLERQRNYSLSSEIEQLQKQVETLGIKIKKIVGFCPREIRIDCGLSQVKSFDEADFETKLSKYLEESQGRERDLKKLLEEKDEEIQGLRRSLSDQVLKKNDDIEKLTNSIENLEDEMSYITSSLNLSSELYTASHRASSFLDSRTKHIQSLQEQVNKQLLSEQGCRSCETNTETIEDLKCEVTEAKGAVRSAREEARAERIEAAKVKQQLALMQIDLESARELAKHHTERIVISKVPELQNFSCLEDV